MLANPVLHKELLMRLRFGRQPTTLRVGICIAIVLTLVWIHFQLFSTIMRHPSSGDGHALWAIITCIQYVFIVLLAPIAAANAITQEREQRTWEMLVFTRLSPAEIIFGKLLSRLLTVVAIIALGLPAAIVSVCYANINGAGSSDFVSPLQFCTILLTQALTGLFFVTFGLFMSWTLKRTLYAVMASYTFVVAGLILGTLLISTILSSLIGNFDFLMKCPLIWFNPVFLMKWALAPDSHLDTVFLIYGLTGYTVLTLLMLWRMIAGFRRVGYEN